MAEQVPFKHVVGGSNPSGLTIIAGSSNGRTGVFGTSNLGSNPGPAAGASNRIFDFLVLYFK